MELPVFACILIADTTVFTSQSQAGNKNSFKWIVYLLITWNWALCSLKERTDMKHRLEEWVGLTAFNCNIVAHFIYIIKQLQIRSNRNKSADFWSCPTSQYGPVPLLAD